MNNKKIAQNNRNFSESQAIATVKMFCADSGRVNTTNIKEGDKGANTDGYIDIKNIDGTSRGALDVQIKGKKKIVSPQHSCSKAFIEYCLFQSLLPVILIIVDNSKKKAYWIHMEKLLCQDALDSMSQKVTKSITIKLNPKNYIQSDYIEHFVDEFVKIINDHRYKLDSFHKISDENNEIKKELAVLQKYSNPAIGKISPIFKEIHLFLDFYNNLLDYNFARLKSKIYPGFWKVGFGIFEYQDGYVNFLLYPIPYESNDIQIKYFKDENGNVSKKLNSYGAIKHLVHFKDNPIKAYPKQYAYLCIKNDLIDPIYKDKLNIELIIKDFFLATEHLFDFLNDWFSVLKLEYRQKTYLLSELLGLIQKYLPHTKNYALFPSTKITNIETVIYFIEYLQTIGIKEIDRDNYFALFNQTSNIIEIRQRFYENILEIYQKIVEIHFPDLVNELQFFNNFNLLIIVFNSSPRNKMTTGVEIGEIQYYLKSLSPTSNKIITYQNADDCPINIDNEKFDVPIEINGISYNLQRFSSIMLNQCESKPLLGFVHDLLRSRLISYLDNKIDPYFLNIKSFIDSDTIYQI